MITGIIYEFKVILKLNTLLVLSPFLPVIFIYSGCKGQVTRAEELLNEEYIKVEIAINNVIGWAVNKDFELFFNTICNDSTYISVTPYNKVKFGVQAVKNDTSFWASPDFKAIRHEIYDLQIHFSSGGEVAWFYCMLDDINTWKGKPANWEKIRWTGVLEKREGNWRMVQQHFSCPYLK